MQQPSLRHIVLDNPPVNGLGFELRQWLLAQVESALADPSVDAVVLRGAGRMFCGGADIRQFGTPKVAIHPLMREVNGRIEAAGKPFVAALHGHALGGGLELAMACHARVAAAGTRIGLPEVTLGIVPGGGGTQRLPRLIGTARGLDWIVTGQRVSAEEASGYGLIDAVVGEAELVTAAEDLASRLVRDTPVALHARTARSRPLSLGADEAAAFFAREQKRLASEYPGRQAPLAALRCVAAAFERSYEVALTLERETFLALVDSEEAARARAAFAARGERSPNAEKKTPNDSRCEADGTAARARPGVHARRGHPQ